MLLFSALILLHCASSKPQWDVGLSADGNYRYMHYSETHDRLANEDLIIWLGPAASGPRVVGKHGEMALPAAWGSFVDVLFVTMTIEKPDSSVDCFTSAHQLWEFVRTLELSYSSVFLAAVWSEEGSCIASVAQFPQIPWSVGGVIIIDGPKTPTALFFAHSSLNTGNGLVETEFSVNRASQPVVCNAPLDRAVFTMNDAQFVYARSSSQTNLRGEEESQVAEEEDFSLSLDHILVPGVGCFAPKNLPLQARSEEMPALLGSKKRDRGQACTSTDTGADAGLSADSEISGLKPLLENPVGNVLLIRTLKYEQTLTCNFYLGIYTSDALRLQGAKEEEDGEEESDTALNNPAPSFNDASLETLWPLGDPSPLGEVQESSSQRSLKGPINQQHRQGQLSWAHLNTREPMSRRAALRVLSAIKGDINELDFFLS